MAEPTTRSKDSLIPVCEPLFLGNEDRYAAEALKTRWISSAGSFISEFERCAGLAFSRQYAATTTSGTTALHLALRVLDIGPGDEVIVPNFTMVAVSCAVLYCGATPVFVDADPETWNIDPALIAAKITAKTKAILPAHTYGHPVDMDPIFELAQKHQLHVIEDAAEAHGATYKGRPCGSLGTISCLSFFANKIITTGEGGMVLTDDKQLNDKVRYFKNLCFALDGPRDYNHDDLGYNYRMTNIQAAIGLGQIENLEQFVARRRNNAQRYLARLSQIPGLQLPVEKDYATNVYWMFGIVVDEKTFGRSRDQLAEFLQQNQIGTRLFFKPLHSQKMLAKFGIEDNGSYPVTERLAANGLYLPSGSGLSEEDLNYVCDKIAEAHI